MGFSTSGATLVIFIALLLAGATLIPTIFGVAEQTGEAFSAQSSHIQEQSNTDISIESATTEEVAGSQQTNLEIQIANTGSTTLDTNKLTVLIDGELYALEQNEYTVANNGETELWLSGETLKITVDLNDQTVDRIKVATPQGIKAIETIDNV